MESWSTLMSVDVVQEAHAQKFLGQSRRVHKDGRRGWGNEQRMSMVLKVNMIIFDFGL